MKKVILTLCILFFTLFSFAQGIAIQGIARDANNTAKTNASISLTFETYYLDTSNNPTSVFSQSITLQTDAFGVFSHVLDVPKADESQFSNKDLYLKITEGTVVISNEIFKRVPLAYSASNGVPTGSIMPFIGTTAPAGWILCDGSTIPVNSNTATLRTLLGSGNAPDLQGMFLRGTGQSPVNSQQGPALKGVQGEAFKSHNHNHTLVIRNAGIHKHRYNDRDIDEQKTSGDYADGDGTGSKDPLRFSQNSGLHSHDMEGSISESGGNETRPVSYGINYIIKL